MKDEGRGTKRPIRFVAPRSIEAVVHPPSVFCTGSHNNPQLTTNNTYSFGNDLSKRGLAALNNLEPFAFDL